MRGSAAAPIRVYTPHGGSLHYSRSSPVGLLYLTLEQVLMRRTELFLFESHYGRDMFTAKVGEPAATGARGAQRRDGSGVCRAHAAGEMRPTSSSSASCACSRASTC